MQKPHSLQHLLDLYHNYLDSCSQGRALAATKRCHAHLLVLNLTCISHFSSLLISSYLQCGHISLARHLFDEMPQRSISRWNTLITDYSRRGLHHETLKIFSQLQTLQITPNSYVLPSIIRSCSRMHNLKAGQTMHSLVIRCLYGCDAFIVSALIDMYAKCGQIEQARKLFDEMPDRDLVTWNAMVSGYARKALVVEALELLSEMKLTGTRPDLVTWNALIAGLADVGKSDVALNLLRQMRGNGIDPDVVSWTSVISGLVKNFCNEEALDVFRQMVASGVQPNSVTISSLLPACATVADLRHGKEIHGHALLIGVERDVFVSSSLVDMYAKCGLLFEARKVFCKMTERSTVTWNSMIFGCANHGCWDEALELFEQMISKEEAKPDHLTFTAVLTACGHAGKVEIGKDMFDLMQEKHRVVPRLEHYACMVDLLGRAGKLSEAYTMIQVMPTEPDAFVWGALLGACKKHGNVELAEIVASHLFELEPESAGSPVLLSNVFAEARRWEDAAILKKMVKRKRLRRNPDCSWIEST